MNSHESSGRTIRIGGACGYWGESSLATPQLLADGAIDFLVYDYLAEITLSIMARARARDPGQGYATDFVTQAIGRNLEAIADQGVKVLSNAGGVNPRACAAAVEQLLAASGADLKVAVVTGDDLLESRQDLAEEGITEMFSGAPFPDPERVASINAYLGARPVAAALAQGADIVITGRCADSALTLAACLHAFDWSWDDWDRLAAGSLAGHLLECGPQATGGNATDWRDVAAGLAGIGYPIAEVAEDGRLILTKPAGTGGAVTPLMVGEQLLYEIEDPGAYVLPDVVCDFSRVRLVQAGEDRVEVSGARGRPSTDTCKVSVTWLDGYRAGMLLSFTGFEAVAKARTYAAAALTRTGRALAAAGWAGLTETSVEVLGAEDQYGSHASGLAAREVVLKLAAKHPDPRGVALFIKEVTGLALATPAGLSMFNAGRPKPQPLVRLFSFLLPKDRVRARVVIDDRVTAVLPDPDSPGPRSSAEGPEPGEPPLPTANEEDLVDVPLIRLAVARSGDKGNRANIGVLARDPAYLPWIWRALTEDAVADRFAHFLEGAVARYWLPGSAAINFVLHDTLGGGGVASLRNDPQGKTYAQILLAAPIPVPSEMASMLS